MSTLVLSPHFDDAVLSAWSVLRGDDAARVVNVCGAIPPEGTLGRWDEITRATDSATRVRERIEEDRRALARAGLEPHNLGFLDMQYRGEDPLPWSEVETALEEQLDGAGVLYAPAALGAHPDHVTVREIALGLGERHGLDVFLYADQPYATTFGWPHWVTGAEPQPYMDPEVLWSSYLAEVGCGPERLRPHVRTLSEEEAERKLEALRDYTTQYVSFETVGAMHGPHVRRWELHWEVAVSPPGAPSR